MRLILKRAYFRNGTNGRLLLDGMQICSTIELPWRNNEPKISCIPEGEYLLNKRYSEQHQWHIEITGVPQRSLILFHPANFALTELKGCIAPVFDLVKEGVGTQSRRAFQRLKKFVYSALNQGEEVILIIQSENKSYEFV